MKKSSTFFAAVLVIAAIFSVIISPAIHAADTSSDPLVTLSYIEEVLAPRLKSELTTYINNNFVSSPFVNSGSETAPENDGSDDPLVPEEPGTEPTPDNPESPVLIPQGYTVVHMTKGQTLYALSPTEVILRSGQANAMSAFIDQGICDMTTGSELYNDDPLTRYHYCLIPRGDDGRGVVAISDEIYIMVRGAYEIREQ